MKEGTKERVLQSNHSVRVYVLFSLESGNPFLCLLPRQVIEKRPISRVVSIVLYLWINRLQRGRGEGSNNKTKAKVQAARQRRKNNKYQAQASFKEWILWTVKAKNTKSIRLRDRGKKERRVNASWLKPFSFVLKDYRFLTLRQLLWLVIHRKLFGFSRLTVKTLIHPFSLVSIKFQSRNRISGQGGRDINILYCIFICNKVELYLVCL